MKPITILLSLLFTLLFASCSTSPPSQNNQKVVITGKIIDFPIEEITLQSTLPEKILSNEKYLIKVDAQQNTFRQELMVSKKGEYFDLMGFPLYLQPKDSLHITIRPREIKSGNGILITGTNQHIEEYMINKGITDMFMINGKHIFNDLQSLPFPTYATMVDSLENISLTRLQDIDPSFHFLEMETKANLIESALFKLAYDDNRLHPTPSFDIKEDLAEELSMLESDIYFIHPIFREFANFIIKHKLVEESGIHEAYLDYYNALQASKILNNDNLSTYQISTIENTLAILPQAYEKIIEKRLSEKKRAMLPLAQGQAAPNFTVLNEYGEDVKLSDFKGGYVYIDIWATWCGPCLSEIPYYRKVKEKFKSKNIQFLSISVDDDTKKWKNVVSQKKMKGFQLIAKKDWRTSVAKDYQLKTIPRFILIDTEGKIIDADAPRPSEERLVEVLKSLNI